MTAERKLRWSAHFFIWSAAVVVLYGALDEFDHWSHAPHPARPLVEMVAYFIGWMAGGLAKRSGLYILLLINGLVLRRYKSRIAAALFVVTGLSAFGLGTLDLILGAPRGFFLAVTIFFGVYLAIAVWTFTALMRLHGKGWPVFVTRLAALRRRPDKVEKQKQIDAYYSLIERTVSQLPVNDPASREKVYDRARGVIAERSSREDLEHERRTLDEAIARVERGAPKITTANPLHQPSTISLVVALFFPRLWLIDVTCMSLYWVARIRV